MSGRKGHNQGVQLMDVGVCQQWVGELIVDLRQKNNPEGLRLAMSISEYLKDARRWHYAQGNILPDDLSGEALKKYVDREIGQ